MEEGGRRPGGEGREKESGATSRQQLSWRRGGTKNNQNTDRQAKTVLLKNRSCKNAVPRRENIIWNMHAILGIQITSHPHYSVTWQKPLLRHSEPPGEPQKTSVGPQRASSAPW